MIRDASLRAESRDLTLARIVAELDGSQWGPDTIETVATILRAAGFVIREPDERDDDDEREGRGEL